MPERGVRGARPTRGEEPVPVRGGLLARCRSLRTHRSSGGAHPPPGPRPLPDRYLEWGPVSSTPPLPETVLVPRVELPPVRPPAPRQRPGRLWWVPTIGEAAVGLLYVSCGFVMVLVFAAMLGG